MDDKKRRALSFLSIRNKKVSFTDTASPDSGEDFRFRTNPRKLEAEKPVGHDKESPRIPQPETITPQTPVSPPVSTRQPPPDLSSQGAFTDEEDFDFMKYLGIIALRKYWLIATMAMALVFVYFINRRAPRVYESTARLNIKINPVQDALGNIFVGERKFLSSSHLVNLSLPDEAFLKMVQNRLDSLVPLEVIEKSYSVKIQNESNLILIKVTNESPEFARNLANSLAGGYEIYDQQFRQRNFLEKEKWIQEQLKKRQDILNRLELDIKEFHEDNPTFNEGKTPFNVLTVERLIKELTMNLEEKQNRLAMVNHSLETVDSVVVSEVTRDMPLRKELLNLEMELARLRVEHGDESRKVKNKLQQIENIKELMDRHLESKSYTTTLQSNPRYYQLQAEKDEMMAECSVMQVKKIELEKLLEEAYRKSAAQPELQLAYNRLLRDKNASEKIYTLLNEKLEETRLKKSSVNKEVFQMGNASKARELAKGRINFPTAIALGLFLGIILCLVVEQLDKSLRVPAEIEKKLGIPVLGIIPELELDTGKIELDSDSKILEPYRNLRTNLNYSAFVDGMETKTLIMTSALQGEGKSTKAVNLAICFSMDGRKILLVDADLRRPSVHSLLGQRREPGLAEYLTGQVNFDEIINKTKFYGLCTVSAGSKLPNPAELLGSSRLDMFLQEARKQFEIIFFDSPAIFPVSDALVLAPKIQSALVVFRSNYTPIKAGEEVLRKLRQVGANVVGGVLNDVYSGRGSYYYSYYGYYGYSYYHNYYEEGTVRAKSHWLGGVRTVLSALLGDIKTKFLWLKSILSFRNAFSFQQILNWSLIAVILLVIANGGVLFVVKKMRSPEFLPLNTAKLTALLPEQKQGENRIQKVSRHNDSLLIVKQINKWAQGLGSLNLPLYFSAYSVVKFKYRNIGFSAWKAKRSRELAKIQDIKLDIRDIAIAFQKSGKARSLFLVIMNVNGKEKQYWKVFDWTKEGPIWLIVKEGSKSVQRELGSSVNQGR